MVTGAWPCSQSGKHAQITGDDVDDENVDADGDVGYDIGGYADVDLGASDDCRCRRQHT